MKTIFSGYYYPSDEEFSALWEHCLFILDANVLLNLYRYSHETSKVLTDILEKISDRLWLPHQVALEYQDNRLEAISKQVKLYDEISKVLKDTEEKLENLLSAEHPSIDVDSLREKIGSAFSEIEEELHKHREQHPNLFESDYIRDTITSLFEGKVGPSYSKEDLDKIYKVGEERYPNEVPPGYKDAKDKKAKVKRYGNLIIKSMYGDLILWLQIIDKAKSEQKPIIFVTDDTKEDWWWTSQGKTIGPRPELITEMMEEAKVPFYMYTPKRFMLYAGEYFKVQVTDEVAEEVQSITEEGISWKEELVGVLKALGGEARLSEIYDYIEKTTSRKLARTWRGTIRYTLYLHCSDTETYKGGEDLFSHLDRGYWGLKDSEESEDRKPS